VTGNTGCLALRQTRAKIANALVAALNQPLISTSAIISGSPTCRSGIEVFGTMDGRVDLVLDGGTCSGAWIWCWTVGPAPARGSGAGRWDLLRRGRHYGGYHGAILEDHPGRRHRGKGNRRGFAGYLTWRTLQH